MQAQIRNRSYCNRQLAVSKAAGISMSDGFAAERSDKLFDTFEDRLLRGMNRKLPSPVFRKVQVQGSTTLMWLPCNERAQIVLQNMQPEQRIDFLLSANSERKQPELPESLRILSSRPVKSTPRGVTESDAFGPNVQMHAKEKPVEFQWKLAGQGVRDCAIAKRLKPTMLDHSVPRGRNQPIKIVSPVVDSEQLLALYAEAKAQSPGITIAQFVDGLTDSELDSVQLHQDVKPTGVHHLPYNPKAKAS